MAVRRDSGAARPVIRLKFPVFLPLVDIPQRDSLVTAGSEQPAAGEWDERGNRSGMLADAEMLPVFDADDFTPPAAVGAFGANKLAVLRVSCLTDRMSKSCQNLPHHALLVVPQHHLPAAGSQGQQRLIGRKCDVVDAPMHLQGSQRNRGGEL